MKSKFKAMRRILTGLLAIIMISAVSRAKSPMSEFNGGMGITYLSNSPDTHIIDSLHADLAAARTAADSVSALYDIFDLSPIRDRQAIGEQLFATVMRTDDIPMQLDVARRVLAAYVGSGPDRMEELINIVALMPRSDEQVATLSFMRSKMLRERIDRLDEAGRWNEIHAIIADRMEDSNDKNEPYTRVEMLFALCRFLQSSVPGDVLTQYITELGEAIDKLPYRLYMYENDYYVNAAFIYTSAGMPEHAVAADRKLLSLIAELELDNARSNHSFRTYDIYRYQIYRRMLKNAVALTPEEIEQAYKALLHLVEINTDVAEEFNTNRRAEIYYRMARGDNAGALAILNQVIELPENKDYRIHLLPIMFKASKALGDTRAMSYAASNYIEMLESLLAERNEAQNREIKVYSELQRLKDAQSQLEMRNRLQKKDYSKNTYIWTIIISIVFIIIIIWMFFVYRKRKILTRNLERSNSLLINERDNLQRMQKELIAARDHARKADRHKTEFINNMSHEVRTPLNVLVECSHIIVDNVEDSKRKYLERFANMIDISADMLRAIVNDVLSIAELENSQTEVTQKPTSVNSICNIAVNSVRKHCKPGVTMTYADADKPDINILTDPARVEQVLINLLNNGAKFTDQGSVTLSYTLNHDQTITFAVTDTGIGVPPGKEDIIFERFEKLSSATEGTGLGLNICRMVATLLKGTVKVDTTYSEQGARFLFTIPR